MYDRGRWVVAAERLLERIAKLRIEGEELTGGRLYDGISNDRMFELMGEFILEARKITGKQPEDLAVSRG